MCVCLAALALPVSSTAPTSGFFKRHCIGYIWTIKFPYSEDLKVSSLLLLGRASRSGASVVIGQGREVEVYMLMA